MELSLVFLLANGERGLVKLDDAYLRGLGDGYYDGVVAGDAADDAAADADNESVDAPAVITKLPIKRLKAHLIHHWPDKWGERPLQGPSLRIIYLGKILDDELTLADYNIVPSVRRPVIMLHLAVRPAVFDQPNGDAARPGKFRLRLHRKASSVPPPGDVADANVVETEQAVVIPSSPAPATPGQAATPMPAPAPGAADGGGRGSGCCVIM